MPSDLPDVGRLQQRTNQRNANFVNFAFGKRPPRARNGKLRRAAPFREPKNPVSSRKRSIPSRKPAFPAPHPHPRAGNRKLQPKTAGSAPEIAISVEQFLKTGAAPDNFLKRKTPFPPIFRRFRSNVPRSATRKPRPPSRKNENRRRRLGSRTSCSPQNPAQSSPAFYGGECFSFSGAARMHKRKILPASCVNSSVAWASRP